MCSVLMYLLIASKLPFGCFRVVYCLVNSSSSHHCEKQKVFLNKECHWGRMVNIMYNRWHLHLLIHACTHTRLSTSLAAYASIVHWHLTNTRCHYIASNQPWNYILGNAGDSQVCWGWKHLKSDLNVSLQVTTCSVKWRLQSNDVHLEYNSCYA